MSTKNKISNHMHALIKLIMAYLLCILPLTALSNSDDTAINVEISKVAHHDFYEKYTAIGQSRAENSKTYYARVDGNVDSVAIMQGQEFTKGQTLITIDTQLAQAAKSKAEAAFALAKSTYERDYSLWQKKFISIEVLDKSKAALESVRADLAIQNDKYQNMIITAPFDGYVGVVHTEVGKDIKIGDYLFTIIANGEKTIFIELPENLSGKINKDSKVSVIDNTGKKIFGTILAVSNYLNDNGTITAKISFPTETKILHGSFIEVEIVFDHHTGLSAPEKAVLKNNKGNFVYKVDENNKAVQIYVQTKTRDQDLIEIITSDLKDGDQIIIGGLTKVYDSALVRSTTQETSNQGS